MAGPPRTQCQCADALWAILDDENCVLLYLNDCYCLRFICPIPGLSISHSDPYQSHPFPLSIAFFVPHVSTPIFTSYITSPSSFSTQMLSCVLHRHSISNNPRLQCGLYDPFNQRRFDVFWCVLLHALSLHSRAKIELCIVLTLHPFSHRNCITRSESTFFHFPSSVFTLYRVHRVVFDWSSSCLFTLLYN